MAGSDILMPFSKLPQLNTATILIIGAQGTGKHKLAKALVDVWSPFRLQVRVATSLPLPAEHAEERPRIDFVIFLIDSINALSLEAVKNSLPKVDVSYFLGRACFVITESKKFSDPTHVDAATQMAEAYNSLLFHVDLENLVDRASLAGKLLKLTEIGVGFKHQVNPLLIDMTRKRYTLEKL